MSATTAEPAMGKGGGKKKLLLAAIAGLALAGGAGWYFGVVPKLLHRESQAHSAEPARTGATAAPIFLDLPEIITNLNAGGRRAAFIKLKAKLELSRKEDAAILQGAMPRVVDLFQGYLRELRPDELRGTAGTYRLREELIARTNLAAAPARVVDVLFVELLVQ